MPALDAERAAKGAIVLVPGLGLGGVELAVLASRLRRRGWPVSIFRHFPWRHSLGEKAAALSDHCRSQPHDVIHLVGHSMGGNIVLACLADRDTGRPGRVLLLGSPVRGSETARRVAGLPLGERLLGRCMNEARRTEFVLPADREVGGIAGRRNVGVGLAVGAGSPGDGVVRLDEAIVDTMVDTSVVDAAHTGMLFSSVVAHQVDGFLRHGRFATLHGDG